MFTSFEGFEVGDMYVSHIKDIVYSREQQLDRLLLIDYLGCKICGER